MIRILLTILLSLFSASLSAQNIQSFRASSAYPGSTAYFWFPKGGSAFQTPTLPSGWTLFDPPNSSGSDPVWYRQFSWGIRIPTNATPGSYNITAGANMIPVTVGSAPGEGTLRRVAPGGSIPAALALTTKIELLPGIHTVTSPISCPDGTQIISAGAWIVRELDPNPANQGNNPVFIPAGALTLDGLVLTHAANVSYNAVKYIHKDVPTGSSHVTVRRCVLKGGRLGWATSSNMLVEDCRFESAMTDPIANNSVWLRNEFVGHTRQGDHAFFVWNSPSSWFMASNKFLRTTRGIVIQGVATRNGVVIDTYMHGVWGGLGNASECILMEAGTGAAVPSSGENGIRDNTFVDTWVIDCAGPAISLYGSGMHDNVFNNNFLPVDSLGVSLVCTSSSGTPTMDDNTFYNTYTTGGVQLVGNSGSTRFENFQIVEKLQGVGNNLPFHTVIRTRTQGFPFSLDNEALATVTPVFVNAYYHSTSGMDSITALPFRPRGSFFPWTQ